MKTATELLQLVEDERAEGDIVLRDGTKFPYSTRLASSAGVHMDIYMGNTKGDLKLNDYSPELKAKLKSVAKSHRDCISFRFIGGTPTGYWAHEIIRESILLKLIEDEFPDNEDDKFDKMVQHLMDTEGYSKEVATKTAGKIAAEKGK